MKYQATKSNQDMYVTGTFLFENYITTIKFLLFNFVNNLRKPLYP